jgi:hypothetical protein
MTTALRLPDLSESASAATETHQHALAIRQRGVRDVGELAQVEQVYAECRRRSGELTALRQSFTKDIRAAIRHIEEYFRPRIAEWDTAAAACRDVANTYRAKVEAERHAAYEKALAASRADAPPSEVRAALVESATDVAAQPGVRYQTKVEPAIMNHKALYQYLAEHAEVAAQVAPVVDAALRKLHKAGVTLPGVEYTEVQSLQLSR